MRLPSPNGPPVQPVLTSQTAEPCSSSFSPSMPGVDRRRLRQERLAEARRERRLRLGDADLGAGELGGEAGEEVVERLLARQLRDRRQDPERVGGQEDDRAPDDPPRFAGSAFAICSSLYAARVFSVFESSSRSTTPFSSIATFSRIVPNVCVVRKISGSAAAREADHLRVAAALDVEDAVVAPAVLVVADQRALGIGGERRLAGAREAEEDRDAPVGADVGRAVHREDALERQAVVHDGEDRLLDLARVERAADEQLGAARMQHDERAGARPVLLRVGLEVGRVQHERLGSKRRLLTGARSMNIVCAKSAWYGCAVITRTPIRCAGSAPAQASTT